MKKIAFSLIISGLFIMSSCTNSNNNSERETNSTSDEPIVLENLIDSLSYSLGVAIGSSFRDQGMDTINYSLFSRSTRDAYNQGDLIISFADANKFVNDYMGKISSKVAATNKAAGQAFLADNYSKEGVITLDDGLQYKILTEGNGPKPEPTSSVTVNYHGTLIDGTVFDSSIERGEPATFQVNQVIPAWQEALQLMSVGSKWKLFVPSDLAYGDQGAGPKIQAGSTLIFEVELLSIN